MKDKFPGHFSKPADNAALWTNCIFIFDTNILLNLYRYSDETRSLFVNTLETLIDKIWIPHRVAAEYLENRLGVIHEQQEEYEKTITEISKLKSKLENSRQHPFVSEKTMKSVALSLDKVKTELTENKETHTARISADEIQESIARIFDGRVGDESTNSKLEEIIKDGIERYKQKIPPGYSDIKKQSDEDTITSRCRPYGDLIIWKDILQKAKKESASVVFITDDGKEDWWLRFKGKTIGPRPELIKEFKNEVGTDFHMYLPERFLSLASKSVKEKPSKEILDEIRDIRQKDRDLEQELQIRNTKFDTDNFNRSAHNKFVSKRYLQLHSNSRRDNVEEKWGYANIGHLERELTNVDNVLNDLTLKKEHLRHLANRINSDAISTPNKKENIQEIAMELNEVERKITIATMKQEEIFNTLQVIYKNRIGDNDTE
ncbi:PIN domain-containing protein [Pseudomonas tumuqii]|uniref:PIN domain-containing protein n=1 Tax=Pseudomonas tumuqii TaxID=2715755 RepID=UPI001554BF9F|nr:PIN domain-containing protein [Pseudomonas tumuqii]